MITVLQVLVNHDSTTFHLALWSDAKWLPFLQNIFKWIFLNENYCILIPIWSWFWWVHLSIGSNSAWHKNVVSDYLKTWWQFTIASPGFNELMNWYILGALSYSNGDVLTHWGWVTHICISKLTNIGSDNGLLPGRHQAIIWTNDGILLIRTLGTNFSEILSAIHTFSFKKMHLKMSSGKWQSFCLGLNVLR